MSAAHPLHPVLPHRAPMLLLDSLATVTAQGGQARVRLRPEGWYCDAKGQTPAWIGLELMAQAIAACRGQHLATTGGVPRGGYLVGTRSYRSALPAFPPGAELLVDVLLLETDPSGLGRFQCTLTYLGRPVAEAILKVMEA